MPPDPSLAQTLLSLRVIWAVMLSGLAALAMLATFLISQRAPAAPPLLPPDLIRMLVILNAFMLFTLIPLGYFVRNQIYKANWVDQIITPKGYLHGNLVLLAICEAIAIKGLVVCILSGSFWPCILPPLGALLALFINFPTGEPMLPRL